MSHSERVTFLELFRPRRFAIGFLSGTAGLLSAYPVDTIKVRIQTQGAKTNIGKVFVDTLRRERFFGLYKGITSPLLTYGMQKSVKFYIFTNLTPFREKYNRSKVAPEDYSLLKEITAPFELFKTQLQVDYTEYGKNRPDGKAGFRNCISHIYRNHGPFKLFHGYVPTLLRDMTFNAFYFSGYEGAKIFFRNMSGKKDVQELARWQMFLSGGFAGCFGWVWIYPIDYFKSRVQGDMNLTFRQALRDPHVNVERMYRGYLSCFLRAFPMHAVTFFTYEVVRKWLM